MWTDGSVLKLHGSAKVLPGLPVGSVGTVAVGKMSCRVVSCRAREVSVGGFWAREGCSVSDGVGTGSRDETCLDPAAITDLSGLKPVKKSSRADKELLSCKANT